MDNMLPITIESLRSGKLLEQLNEELFRIAGDVIRRPDCPKPRTLALKLAIKPNVEAGQNWPEIHYEVEARLPSNIGGMVRGVVDRAGNLTIPAKEPEQTDIENLVALRTANQKED